MTLKEALELYDRAKKYVDTGYRYWWDRYYSAYKRRRVIRHYEGISDPVIPEAFNIIETLVANIASGDVTFHFVKTKLEQTDEVDVLNGMLDYFMICNQMPLKNQEWVREMLLYGTGILYITWKDGKPFIDNIPIRNFFVDPAARNLEEARYAGFTYLIDRPKAERMMIYDPETDAMVPYFSNLDKLKNSTATGGANSGDALPMDKVFKDQFNNSTLIQEDAVKEQIAMIYLVDLYTGKLIEIGNRKVFARNVNTPFQRDEKTRKIQVPDPSSMQPGPDGQPDPASIKLVSQTQTLEKIDPFLPFAVLRDYIDVSLFYGEGEMAVILDRAEMLNDLEAMDTDNLAIIGTPMFQIDPQFADLAPEIETIPGAVYPIPKGALTPIPVGEIAANLDEKKDRIIAQMRAATAADEAVQGISQGKSRTTATEVDSQANFAANRFSTKTQNLENEGYTQLADRIYKMCQIFIEEPTKMRMRQKGKTYFGDYDPWKFAGEWEPHPQLDSTTKKQQVQVGMKLNQVFQAISNNPIYDPVEVQRFIVQHLDPDMSDEAFNKLLAKAPPDEDKSKDYLQVNYKDLEPWGRFQAQKDLGWEPDPALQGDMQNRMLEQGSRAADLSNPATDTDNTVLPGLHSLGAPAPTGPAAVPPPAAPVAKPAGMR